MILYNIIIHKEKVRHSKDEREDGKSREIVDIKNETSLENVKISTLNFVFLTAQKLQSLMSKCQWHTPYLLS